MTSMRPGPGEPSAGPWRIAPMVELVGLLGIAGEASADDLPSSRPRDGGRRGPTLVAIDGRSSGGKTSLASRLAGAVPGTTVVHTDDIAWFHSAFDWADLLVDGILRPLRDARDVAYRPPPWETRGRGGAIEVPGDAVLVIVEGVGAGRRHLAPWFDAILWVQSDSEDRARRDAERVAAGEIDPESYERWMAEEIPFVADQRSWERAVAIVAGSPVIHHDPATQVVIAPPTR